MSKRYVTMILSLVLAENEQKNMSQAEKPAAFHSILG